MAKVKRMGEDGSQNLHAAARVIVYTGCRPLCHLSMGTTVAPRIGSGLRAHLHHDLIRSGPNHCVGAHVSTLAAAAPVQKAYASDWLHGAQYKWWLECIWRDRAR